jgi:hypothetical protein
MRMGVEGTRVIGAENRAGADRDGAARETVRVRDTERRGPPREVDVDVRAGAATCLREAGTGIQTSAPVRTSGC